MKKLNGDTITRMVKIIRENTGIVRMSKLELAMKSHNTTVLSNDARQRDLKQSEWINTQMIKNSLNPNR